MQYSSVCLAFIVSILIAHAFCLPVSLCLVGEIWHTDILIFQKRSDFESGKRERGKGRSCTFGRCNVVSSYPQEDRPCVPVILMTAALMMFIHRCPPERWSPHHICGKKYFCKSPTIIDGCCEESSGGVLAQRCKKMLTFLPSKWQSFLLLGGRDIIYCRQNPYHAEYHFVIFYFFIYCRSACWWRNAIWCTQHT